MQSAMPSCSPALCSGTSAASSREQIGSSPSSSACSPSGCSQVGSLLRNPYLSSTSRHSLHRQLYVPSSAIAPFAVPGQHSSNKRIAASQLDDHACRFGSSDKRPSVKDVQSGNKSCDAPSTHTNDQICGAAHGSGVMVVDIRSQCIGSIAGDLDDVLDLLLQDAEVAVSATAKEQVHSGLCEGAPISVSESSTRGNHLPKESISPSDVPQTKSSSSPQRHASAGHIVGQRHAEMGANEESHVQSWVTPTVIQEEKPNVFSFPHGWPNQRVLETLLSCPRAVPREEVTEREQKEFPLSRSSHRWAGPTLMDIETALATACPSSACNIIAEPALSSSSPDSFWSTRLPHRNSALIRSVEDILKQETSSFLTASSSSVCNEEPKTPEDDDMNITWRRWQKRSQMEPRYTMKIRCEGDAVNDGYRWRKYGQKSIKNSSHPRSYYRCSSGKCKVKKQVERSSEDAGMLVVSYEGIHLHHRPTSLPMPSTHACVSLLPTHDNPFQKSFPM